MLVRAIVAVGIAIVGEWIYVAFSGDYLDCSGENCGPAWGLLRALWIGLLVLFAVLFVALLAREARRIWGRSHPV
jgi:hypothetical protein